MEQVMVTTTIRISPELHQQIRDAAYADGTSGNTFVVAAIEAALASRETADAE